jgi:hypothetical protein
MVNKRKYAGLGMRKRVHRFATIEKDAKEPYEK